MTITMRFSSSRIDDLKTQTNKDEFKNSYEQLLLSNMSSNYHNWKRYEILDINMKSWSNWFTYALSDELWKSEAIIWFAIEKQTITKITINNEEKTELNIQLKPYEIWCKINDQENSEVTIQTQENNKAYCLKITTEMCKWEYISCP